MWEEGGRRMGDGRWEMGDGRWEMGDGRGGDEGMKGGKGGRPKGREIPVSISTDDAVIIQSRRPSAVENIRIFLGTAY